MDIRNTLSVGEDFLPMLADCKERKVKAEMILDRNGLERAEGFVKNILNQSADPAIELEDGTVIQLKTIVAVNGLFLPSYSEC
ncbi:hypothetical protein [Dyadobacter sp. 676]|uniref:Uncharacterized protein n=1 Tax=Dyadobacter sp. 676 TaxID=3088362 RepID=A0AAU8FHZ0_9BACT